MKPTDYSFKYYALANGFPTIMYYSLQKLMRDIKLYGNIGTVQVIKVANTNPPYRAYN